MGLEAAEVQTSPFRGGAAECMEPQPDAEQEDEVPAPALWASQGEVGSGAPHQHLSQQQEEREQGQQEGEQDPQHVATGGASSGGHACA